MCAIHGVITGLYRVLCTKDLALCLAHSTQSVNIVLILLSHFHLYMRYSLSTQSSVGTVFETEDKDVTKTVSSLLEPTAEWKEQTNRGKENSK